MYILAATSSVDVLDQQKRFCSQNNSHPQISEEPDIWVLPTTHIAPNAEVRRDTIIVDGIWNNHTNSPICDSRIDRLQKLFCKNYPNYEKNIFAQSFGLWGSPTCDPINNTQWESQAAAWGQNILRYRPFSRIYNSTSTGCFF